MRFDAFSDPNWYQLYRVILGYADLPLVNTETAKKFVRIGQVSRSACMRRRWYFHLIRKNMRIVCPLQSRLHSIKRKGANVENLFKCESTKAVGDFPDQIFCHVRYFQILQGRVWRSACMRRRWYLHLIRQNMRIVCLRVKVFRRWVMDTLSRLHWTTLKKPSLFEKMLWSWYALRESPVRKINRVLCYMTEVEWPWIAEDGDESRRPNKPTQKWRESEDTCSPS